jgi:hypothetical protein
MEVLIDLPINKKKIKIFNMSRRKLKCSECEENYPLTDYLIIKDDKLYTINICVHCYNKETKTCTECNEEKLYSEYYFDKTGKGSVRAICKKCHDKVGTKYNKEHPTKRKSNYKQYSEYYKQYYKKKRAEKKKNSETSQKITSSEEKTSSSEEITL